MAFKMKGSPMARNYGAPFTKHKAGHTEPEDTRSTSETTNLLNDLTNYEEVVKEKNERDTKPTTYRESDLKKGKGGYDSAAENPANKPQRDALVLEQEAKNKKNSAESNASYIANKAKVDASGARAEEKRATNKAANEASKAETARRNALGAKGRKKEDKAEKRATRKA
jgi:hypothetical protein